MDPIQIIGIVILSIFLVFFLFVFLYMPIVGVAPAPIVRCEARLLRCLKCKKPGAKPFTYNEIVPRVFLGALPHNPSEVRSLITQHEVGGFVTMNCSWELPGNGQTTTVQEVEKEGIQVCHLPTPDYSAVGYTDLVVGADFIHQTVETTQKGCYVHCNAGKGRSTMVVLAYMIKYKNMKAVEALRLVEEKRKIANFLCCCGIRPQWRGVLNFEKRCGRGERVQDVGSGGGKRSGKVAPET